MGVGKTTIGRVLADSMGREFLDSDREIEAATGADIPWIFDVEGEEGFRARESRMIEMLTTRSNIILATGAERCSQLRIAAGFTREAALSTCALP